VCGWFAERFRHVERTNPLPSPNCEVSHEAEGRSQSRKGGNADLIADDALSQRPLFMLNVGDVFCDSGYECRPCFVITTVATIQVFITGVDEYILERWNNPTGVWTHGNGRRQVKINKVMNSDRRNGYPRFITAFQPLNNSSSIILFIITFIERSICYDLLMGTDTISMHCRGLKNKC
jgi:hypothetical protein